MLGCLMILTTLLRLLLPVLCPSPDFSDVPPMVQEPPRLNYSSAPANEIPAFRPDTMNVADWTKMGVPTKLAIRIGRYQAGGGSIRDTNDLKKIYGLDPASYHRLASHLVSSALPDRKVKGNKVPPEKVDLNLLDSAGLVALPGLGPVSACKIIRFRTKLGGFNSLQQLYDIRGIDSVWLGMALPRLVVRTPPVRLSLNRTPVASLMIHPYVHRKLALWVEARRKLQLFNSVDEIKNFPMMNDSLFEKLLPYLEP